ncbi:hypothetical protein SAMN06893096_102623 [Geodermatophilus pulveris]|uniref:Uncharacterized protein n=1 Tax=Geodermatophilus pulveris TaxID=1564159 RepID=A0A239CUB5_9ACTN|nr:hypothetical protein [Geodermatophilus pulveris]SNS23378.1 hypothetical protein SAMN06893096_102623 [Geodermatophilus pulveris]
MTTLVDGLFDDAALFPPGNVPMAAAVPAHRELRARLGELVGPFVVPAARLGELVAHVGDGEPLGVSVIAAAGDLPPAAARVAASPGLTLTAVETPVVADAPAAHGAVRALDEVLPASVPAAVEIPRSAARDEVLDVLAGTRYRAKLRTGGLRAHLFPSPEELAATLSACVARGVAVKCTAGLHGAVRHTDPATGLEHHGFLNVLAACAALAAGEPATAAERWLREDDAGTLAGGWSPDRVACARAVFTSFGTCSVLEPVEDLVRSGLLPFPDRTPA